MKKLFVVSTHFHKIAMRRVLGPDWVVLVPGQMSHGYGFEVIVWSKDWDYLFRDLPEKLSEWYDNVNYRKTGGCIVINL